MGTTERKLLWIGGLVPLPWTAVCAFEYAVSTGRPLLETLSIALLAGLAFGLLAGAALGQFFKHLPMRQVDGAVIVDPRFRGG